jgi:hypothetical protein
LPVNVISREKAERTKKERTPGVQPAGAPARVRLGRLSETAHAMRIAIPAGEILDMFHDGYQLWANPLHVITSFYQA